MPPPQRSSAGNSSGKGDGPDQQVGTPQTGTQPTGGRPTLFRHIGLWSATGLVIANIVGAGIFTTTGFQAQDLGHPGLILSLWVVGGVLAFCGALAYAELGAAMPEAGGEYVYLRETYGPLFGFMSAFVSLVAGFSAPIAAATKSLVRYASHFFPVLETDRLLAGIVLRNDLLAILVVWLLVGVHFRGARGGLRFNDLVTVFKVVGIVGILVAAVAVGKGQLSHLATVSDSYRELGAGATMAALGTSLIFVSFCYSGWNAAAYVAGEMHRPQRDLPRALLLGTGFVTLLYLGLNMVYLYGADVDQLAGVVEVGLIAGKALFGPVGVALLSLVLLVSILASASAMTLAGPRVYFAFGRDFPALSVLARVRPGTGAPAAALVLQGGVTTLLILSGRVDQIQQYAGFTLSLFTSLAVTCVFVLRARHPGRTLSFRVWGYPLTPLLFLAISVWTMFWAFRGRPVESSLALTTVAVGGLAFLLVARRSAPAER